MLDDPDIKDMFALTYPAGDKGLAPAINFDPGRIRYMPLFLKMYSDCQKTNIAAGAADVVWLRSKYGKTVKFSKINGAAAALQKVVGRTRPAAGQIPGVPETTARQLQLPADRGHQPSQRAWTGDRRRYRRGAFTLLAVVETRCERPRQLQERDPVGDRAGVRSARLRVGRQVVSLRHHAFRVPARDPDERQIERTTGRLRSDHGQPPQAAARAEQERLLPRVAGEPGGALELRPWLRPAGRRGTENRPWPPAAGRSCARPRPARSRRRASSPASGPKAMLWATARLRSTTGDGMTARSVS